MVDINTKGIVCLHLFIVALMALVQVPHILLFSSLFWGVCCWFAIPITEEAYYIPIPSLWPYRVISSLGIINFVIL